MSRKNLTNFLINLSLILTFSFVAQAQYSEGTNVSNNRPLRQNERIMLGFVRQMYDIQATYYDGVGRERFARDLWALYLAGLVDVNVGIYKKYGYSFAAGYSDPSEYAPSQFHFVARPLKHGKTGRRSFYIDSKCYIRGTDEVGQYPDRNNPILETCDPYLARRNEQPLPATLRWLASAEETYRATMGGGNYAGNLETLYNVGLINEGLRDRYYQYYYFTGQATSGDSNTQPTFSYKSKPLIYRESGVRSFYIDQTGIIRGADRQGNDADADDPPIDQLK